MKTMPRIRLAPQLSDVTLDHVLSGETCEPISLVDFEAYLTYKEHTPENLRFVVWYQDYRRRFFALPPDIQRLSPGPAAHDFDFALPTPARIARRVGRGAEDGAHLAEGGGDGEPLSPTSSVRTQQPDDSWAGSPQTPMSTAPLLRGPGAFTPGPARRLGRTTRPRSLFLSPSSAGSSVPPSASTPATPLTAPSLPSPSLVSCPPVLQPFRREVTAIAATFVLPSAPQEICLPALLRTRVLLDVARNTHPDVLLPVYEAAYEALRATSLPTWLRAQEANMGWEKRMYWWVYGALTSLVGWAIVCGCVFGSGVRREWRLWAVPFLCLGGMQMYAGYRGFCTQIWGRGGMQLHPWELAHPTHLTLVNHGSDANDAEAEDQRRPMRPSSTGSVYSDDEYSKKDTGNSRTDFLEVQYLDNNNPATLGAQSTILEESREDGLDQHMDGASRAPFISPFAFDVSMCTNTSTDIPALSRPRADSRVLKRLDTDLAAGTASPPRPSPLRFSTTPSDMNPQQQAGGYRDAWDAPCPWATAPPPLPATPPVAIPAPAPAPSRTSSRAPEFAGEGDAKCGLQPQEYEFGEVERVARPGWWARTWRRNETSVPRGKAKRARGLSMSARARVFGPERVVLDPRIKAVHRRVMRDILVVGFVWGVVLTVVVLALPHRH